MRIFDCFMYFDEDLLLEIRLETLFNHVDQFIIVEANLDHAGNERKPQFDIKKFTKYKQLKPKKIDDIIQLNRYVRSVINYY